VICLAELMFFSMDDQPRLDHLKETFYGEMDYEAKLRALETYIRQALERIPEVIREDKDFVDNDVFNATVSNRAPGDDGDEDAEVLRNRGLGPRLANMILENAFGRNDALKPVYEDIRRVVELEFNNAYGHASIACSKFNIV